MANEIKDVDLFTKKISDYTPEDIKNLSQQMQGIPVGKIESESKLESVKLLCRVLEACLGKNNPTTSLPPDYNLQDKSLKDLFDQAVKDCVAAKPGGFLGRRGRTEKASLHNIFLSLDKNCINRMDANHLDDASKFVNNDLKDKIKTRYTATRQPGPGNK